MSKKGFLLVTMQPPPAFEEEFNAWYDTEHIPERLAVPGILSGLRFVCLDGHPRYLAMYDLENLAVLDSPAYLKVAFDRSSPWTKRVTGRVKVWRSAGHQIYPGDAVTKPSSRVLLIRVRGASAGDEVDAVAGFKAMVEGRRELGQVRVLAHDSGSAGTDLMAFIELTMPLAAPMDVGRLGRLAGRVDLFNTYAPY